MVLVLLIQKWILINPTGGFGMNGTWQCSALQCWKRESHRAGEKMSRQRISKDNKNPADKILKKLKGGFTCWSPLPTFNLTFLPDFRTCVKHIDFPYCVKHWLTLKFWVDFGSLLYYIKHWLSLKFLKSFLTGWILVSYLSKALSQWLCLGGVWHNCVSSKTRLL